MKKMLRLIIKYRKITLFLTAMMVVGGMYSYYMLPKQEAPDFKVPYAMVTAVYPGASPKDMEQLVTSKIEDEVSSVTGYKTCRSISGNSFSTVIAELEFSADPEKSWDELRRKMQDLQEDLPSGCNRISVNTNITDTAGIIISLTGENYNYDQLKYYGDKIIKELSKIDGIKRFEMFGDLSKRITVEVDEAKLSSLNLSYSDLMKLIAGQNIEIPYGKISENDSKININTDGVFRDISDIGGIILGVSSETGTIIRLKDIAEIYYETDDSACKLLHNGENAILLTGYLKTDQNILICGKDVEKKIDEIKKDLPRDLTFDEVLYQPKDVENAIGGFNQNLIVGVILVIVVVFVGFGMRNAIIVSTAIPFSIFITFLLMPLFGIKIHQVSIASLIVALGMLVDNAIVLSDSIQIRIDEGMEKLEACVTGVKDVIIPMLTSTLTTVAAYCPLLYLNSIAGDYVKSIPQIVIISLAASYFIAVFVTPVMAYMFFKPSKNKNAKETYARKLFRSMLNFGLNHRVMIIGAVVICLCISGYLASKLDLIFFPKADKDMMYIDFTAERNIDIDYTEKIVSKIIKILDSHPEIECNTVSIGSGMPRFYDTLSVYSQSPDIAQIVFKVNLNNSEKFKKNSEFAEYLQNEIKANITGGKATVKELEYAFPIAAPIGITLEGNDVDKLILSGNALCQKIQDIEGTYNVFDDYSNLNYEYTIDIDKDRASYFGLTKYDIQNEISIAVRGREASKLKSDTGEQPIVVKSDINTLKSLENIKIKSQITGKKVLLKEVAQLKLTSAMPSIRKTDGEYSMTINSFVHKGYKRQDIINQIKEIISKENFQDINVIYGGEDSFIQQNFKDMGYLAVIALVIVYIVLLIQFKSFKQPLVILVTVPLSLIGIVIGMYATHQPISFTALLGVVSLFGIVVNNAIILLDYINVEVKNGSNIREACIEASGRRLRPILLSTITTVVGLIPLAVGKADLFRPMAVALMSGLLVSTLLTLIVIPVISSKVIKQ